MHKLILTLSFLLAALVAQAGRINGISIKTAGEPVIVFVDGEQICTPTASCFIARIIGSHQIEVYSVRYPNRDDRSETGELLYKERIYCNGSEIKDVYINNRRPSIPNNHRPERPSRYEGVMERGTFDRFLKTVKDANFDSNRTKLVDASLVTAYFTSEQCRMLIEQYTFDSGKVAIMKKIYPRIVDKQNFFDAVNALTFQSDKDKMNTFIRQYHD